MQPTWAITFGDYALLVDRNALTFHLTETRTGTVWADGLSLGWMEVRERQTGTVTRHPFGAMQSFSVSEKAGPQGKRILFGLDCEGIPVDLYLICSQREIQIQVEANRDSKTHTIAGFGLVPGLCIAPADGKSYLVVPCGEGGLLFPHTIVSGSDDENLHVPEQLRIWRMGVFNDPGLTMPFVGATLPTSALMFITDSIYGHFRVARNPESAAIALNPEYARDPEHRRLDLRILTLPSGTYLDMARCYREKIIADNNHVTLRRKIREKPRLESLPGTALFSEDVLDAPLAETLHRLRHEIGIDRGVLYYPTTADAEALARAEDYLIARVIPSESSDVPELVVIDADELVLADSDRDIEGTNLWDALDRVIQQAKTFQKTEKPVQITSAADCFLIAQEIGDPTSLQADEQVFFAVQPVPLYAVVYHDCLTPFVPVNNLRSVLRALLHLAVPSFCGSNVESGFLRRTYALLSPLHRLTFAAFLTGHRFLNVDFQVEEAIYSDKTRVVINQSETDPYESDELMIPPQGFYVRHPQFEAHDVLRLGNTRYATRAWRIRHSTDGKPL